MIQHVGRTLASTSTTNKKARIATIATLMVASILVLFGATRTFAAEAPAVGRLVAEPTVYPVNAFEHRFDGDEKFVQFFPGQGHAGKNLAWSYNDLNRPASIPSAASAIATIQAAMAKWSAVCSITFTYQGTTTQTPESSPGLNVVGWSLTAWPVGSSTTGDATVGSNGTNLTGADIRFNANFQPDLGTTAVHEVGHAIGLNHSDVNGAVMSGPPLSSYNGSSTLSADDIAGCVSLYGSSGGPPPGPDTQAPTVPSNLAATATGMTTVNLTWTASTDNVAVTSYQIFNGATSLGTVASVGATVNSLNAGTMYTFRVRACDTAGNCSAQSSPASATTQAAPGGDTQAPTVPSNLAANATGQTTINLTWTASTDNVGVTGYKVFNGATELGTVASAGATVNALTPGTMYTFRVSACDAAGNCSAQSTAASATTQSGGAGDTQAPTVPANLSATSAGATAINLAWTASTDNVGVANYRVFNGATQVGTVGGTSATVTGLSASTTYTFRVSACDADGNCSAQSNAASATTGASTGDTLPPSVVNGLTATPASGTLINLFWLTSSDNFGPINYRVFVNGTLNQTVTTSNAGVNGLTPNTLYTFTIVACDGAGNCAVPSNPVSARTLDGSTSTPTQNYQDLWWSPAENGWGLTITQHGEALFMAWYIYDTTGKPVWVVLSSGTWDAAHTTYSGSVYIPTSSWFGNYDANRFAVGTPVGTASLRFTGASNAVLTYTVNGVSGTKAIERQLFGVVDTSPIANYSDMWWGGAAQNGWGLVLTQQYHNLFGAWFTYDTAGQTTWYVMTAGSWTTPSTYSGDLYRTRGSPVLGTGYNPASLAVTKVGTLTLTFSDVSTATMTYTVDGLTQTKSITRLPF